VISEEWRSDLEEYLIEVDKKHPQREGSYHIVLER